MSANLSEWLLEDIDEQQLEDNTPITPLATDDAYVVYGNAYNNYYNYTVYYDYYNYSDYYNYYNYYNYSNSISVTQHPISQSAKVGDTVTFSVSASNTIDSCQWYYADSADGAGTAIEGATNPTYSFNVLEQLDGRYYYCVVRRGGNSATSSRALLTVMSLTTLDVCLAVGDEFQIVLVNANPPTTTIDTITVEDDTVATVSAEGLITGIDIGQTDCTVVGTNGVTTTFRIIVLEDPLVAIFMNLGIATRAYRSFDRAVYPNQVANFIRGEDERLKYDTVEELFADIADAIRGIDGTTEGISPIDFYTRILSLI